MNYLTLFSFVYSTDDKLFAQNILQTVKRLSFYRILFTIAITIISSKRALLQSEHNSDVRNIVRIYFIIELFQIFFQFLYHLTIKRIIFTLFYCQTFKEKLYIITIVCCSQTSFIFCLSKKLIFFTKNSFKTTI